MSASVAARMEQVAREAAADWDLPLGPRIMAGRYSYVAPAGDAILKVVPPEDDDADQIAEALRIWNGDGAVRLLRYDADRRALLLERVIPGNDASALDEDEAQAVAIDVGRKIWCSAPTGPHPFRTIHHWVRRWLPADHTHPLVPVARRIYESMDPRLDRIVHADFHHYNLLRRRDAWVAIDPKPYAGEPEFDIISFLANPIATEPSLSRTERRIRAFADAGLDGDGIRRWAIVRGVLDGLPSRPGEPENPRLKIARSLL